MGSMLKKVKNIPEMKKGDIWGFVVELASGKLLEDGTPLLNSWLVIDKVNSEYLLQPLDIDHSPVWMTTKHFLYAYNKGLLVKKA